MMPTEHTEDTKEEGREKAQEAQKPVIIVGWPTIAQLAAGRTVELSNVVLLPDDLLFNTAARIRSGSFDNVSTDPKTGSGS